MTTASRPSPDTLVPEWLRNVAALSWRILVSTGLVAVIVYIAMELAVVTGAALIAGIIAATFAPFVLRLRDRGWSRTRAAAVVTLGALVTVAGTVILIALAFNPYASDVALAFNAGLAELRSQLAAMGVPREVTTLIHTAIGRVGEWLTATAIGLARALVPVVTTGLLALALTFFLLQDGDKAWVWLFQEARGERLDRITSAGHDALERVGGYLRGVAVLAGTDAVSDFVFLTLLGVPLAAPLAVLVFLGGFIPYVGGAVTTTLLVLVTLATQGPEAVVILLVLVAVMNLVQGNLLAPLIYGKTVNIHPALVLLALPAGAALGGIVGLFVAIPIVAMILAVWRAVVETLDPGPEHRPSALVPGWLDRLAQWSWRLLVAIAVAAVATAIAVSVPLVVIPLVVAIVLAATLHPLVDRLVRRGWRRIVAAVTVTGGTALVVIVIVGLAAASLIARGADVVAAASSGAASATDGGGSGSWMVELVQSIGLGVLATIAAVVAGFASLAVMLFLAGLLCFYLLRDGPTFWRSFIERLPPGKNREVETAGSRATAVLGGYMLGTGAIAAFGAVSQYLLMTALGLPLALSLAVLTFFGGFIPYVGSLLTTGLALLVTVGAGNPQATAVMLAFTVVFNVVQGTLVAPLVYGRVVGLHPAVVLMAIPAGSEIAGVVGMFLAVPVLGVIAATWHSFLRLFATGPDASLDASVAVPPTGPAALPAPAVEAATRANPT